MAVASAFINTSRARISAFLKALEDIDALQREFTADGGFPFVDEFEFKGEGTSTYDMTQAEYHAMLIAAGQMIQAFDGAALAASATRTGDLYKGKL
jgi:hypothetical protein